MADSDVKGNILTILDTARAVVDSNKSADILCMGSTIAAVSFVEVSYPSTSSKSRPSATNRRAT